MINNYMKLFSIFLKLLCSTNNYINKKNSADQYIHFLNSNNIKIENQNENRTGIDERPIINKDLDQELTQINLNMLKKNILDTLVNPNINIFHKIEIINKYDILNDHLYTNISAAGLLDDFNFEIF